MIAKSEADPQLGRTLGGQYRIEALLGAGGMGRVYRGRQLSVNRPVAIKLIAGSAPHPPEWVSRFRREAEATASLSHPNSVRLFDFGVTESEELFMVMELLEGTDLARQLAAHGALPVVTALSVTRQVLLALCEAHALGITHRDIKPDNIFLASVRGADVVAKVMDFGIAGLAQAQHKSRLTGTGVIIGTPLYMSPEQAQGIPVDNKSDLYSLGVVLFEMLTGRPVFESNTAVTLLLAHVSRPPRRLDEVGAQLREQASLQALLDRLLAKEPAARPNASEALDTVTALSARLGIAGATGSMRAPPPLPAARVAEEPEFQAARVTGPHTHSTLRPGAILLGAGLVLTAATALALRWVPALIEATQPRAAETVNAAATAPEPEPRTVLIESQPSGAQVLLDGEKIGVTPYPLELRKDTEISVARSGYSRQLVTVSRATSSPVLVKLVPHTEPKLSTAAAERSAPLFFSWKPDNSPRIEKRQEDSSRNGGAEKRREGRRATAPRTGEDTTRGQAELPAFEPSVLVTRSPDELRADMPLPAAEAAPRGMTRDHATARPDPQSRARPADDAPYARNSRDNDGILDGRDPHGDDGTPNGRDAPYARNSRDNDGILDGRDPHGDDGTPNGREAPYARNSRDNDGILDGRDPHGDDGTPNGREAPYAHNSRDNDGIPDGRDPHGDDGTPTGPDAPYARNSRDNVGTRDGRDTTYARNSRDNVGTRDGRDTTYARDSRNDASTRDGRSAERAWGDERERGGDSYRVEREPGASQPTAAEGRRIEAVQEDEVSEIALDDDERAHVAKHYGLRALGRAIARAVGKLLIPYPDRARRAALAEMPLQYLSFRAARAAFKHREIDETGFQEAVWQLRERRRRKITVERDRYARGELTQGQYEAQMDRIWDEFWGRR